MVVNARLARARAKFGNQTEPFLRDVSTLRYLKAKKRMKKKHIVLDGYLYFLCLFRKIHMSLLGALNPVSNGKVY